MPADSVDVSVDIQSRIIIIMVHYSQKVVSVSITAVSSGGRSSLLPYWNSSQCMY